MAVSLQGHSRREHEVFQHFHSVYCFEAIFANVRAGWEKGSVENLVGYARRNYLVPLPEGKDLELLNADLRYAQLRALALGPVRIAHYGYNFLKFGTRFFPFVGIEKYLGALLLHFRGGA